MRRVHGARVYGGVVYGAAVNLREVFARLEEFDPDETIYAEGDEDDWAPETRAVVRPGDPEGRTKVDGLTYVLEVDQALEVADVRREHLEREITPDERFEAIVHYARNDAYLP